MAWHGMAQERRTQHGMLWHISASSARLIASLLQSCGEYPSSIYEAASHGHVVSLQYMVELGIDLHQVSLFKSRDLIDEHNMSALHRACMVGAETAGTFMKADFPAFALRAL